MPKIRKTRKQKIQHDQKNLTVHDMIPSPTSSSKTETHQTEKSPLTTETYSLPATEPKTHTLKKETDKTVTVSTSEYGYLSNDLMRTALLTGAIVFAELLIRLFVVHS